MANATIFTMKYTQIKLQIYTFYPSVIQSVMEAFLVLFPNWKQEEGEIVHSRVYIAIFR